MKRVAQFIACAVVLVAAEAAAQGGLQSSDLLKLRSVSAVQVSPDAARVAYVVDNNDGSGRPYGQIWVMTLADGKSVRFGADKEPSGSPVWSPDSQSIAYRGRVGDKTGLIVARPDGGGARFIAEMSGTNAPLPGSGRTIAWSPDSRRIAFVSSVPGPETAAATGDPMVITRYLYKPDAAEGMTRFNDNRRLHLYVADLSSGEVGPLTEGIHYEHSIDWSTAGDLIFPLESRRRRRPVLQLRHVRDENGRPVGPAAECDREQRIPSTLVARRFIDRVRGDAARADRSRDDDGGHPRVGDECRRHEPPRGGHD